MAIYNGTGEGYGDLIAYTNFTIKSTPGEIWDLGVRFDEIIVPDIDKKVAVKIVDTYFVPSQDIFNHSYFVV